QTADNCLYPAFATRCYPLGLAARIKIISVCWLQVRCQVWPFRQSLHGRQSVSRVREPSSVFVVGGPISRRTFDAVHDSEQPAIFGKPALEQAPLTQQRLMHRLYGHLASALGNISGQKALLDKQID